MELCDKYEPKIEKIKHEISPEVSLQTTENKTGEKISIPTLYLRIDRGLMKCKNIHLGLKEVKCL